MPWTGAADCAVIFYADQEDAAAAIGQAYNCFDEVAVVQWFSLLSLELHLVPLAGGDPALHFVDQVCGVGLLVHAGLHKL
jgi:hypothetical protein